MKQYIHEKEHREGLGVVMIIMIQSFASNIKSLGVYVWQLLVCLCIQMTDLFMSDSYFHVLCIMFQIELIFLIV